MTFYLKNLELVNFRCYTKKQFTFSPRRNIIVGSNAVGKTSLVEGIHCLGFGKSFKNARDIELIKKNKPYYNLKGDFLSEGTVDKVICSYNQKDKRIIKNNYIYKSISDYLGYFKIIVFAPDDLELVKGSPSVRRKFLDVHIGQVKPSYLQALIRYKKLLKERNEFLKSITSDNYDKILLEVITSSLITEAKTVITERQSFIEEVNKVLNPILFKLSNERENIRLVYKPNCNVENLWKSAREKEKQDVMMETTTWGPSRDEMLIVINGENAASYCSQGQIRSACLAIKLGLVELIKKETERIIIILDDVFSELDNHRQNEILKLLDPNLQTFITTTTIESLNPNIIDSSLIINIERGNDDE